jgi:type 1 glutamine amidotransferase
MKNEAGRPNGTRTSLDRLWSRRTWLGACALTASTVSAEKRSPTQPVRVLLVTGGHDHELSFYSIFDGQQGITVNVNPHPSAFRNDPTPHYDVLVLYDLVQLEEVDNSRQKNLTNFVESGKGVLILHHAICRYTNSEWWWREVAGVRYLLERDGNQPASTYKHGENLKIAPTRTHPVLDGVGEIRIVDETYQGMWMSKSNTVLLTTDNPTSDGPVAWISSYEKSRVVVIQPGHGRDAHTHPGYRRLLRNAIFWSASAAKLS